MKYTLKGDARHLRISWDWSNRYKATTCFACQIEFLHLYQYIKFLSVDGDPFYRSINHCAWWWVSACQVDM